MVNYYFEISDNIVDRVGGKYYTTGSSSASSLLWDTRSRNLMEYSDRAWCEQDGRVWFIKHRTELAPTVDLEEFVWIKLRAEAVRG